MRPRLFAVLLFILAMSLPIFAQTHNYTVRTGAPPTSGCVSSPPQAELVGWWD